MSLKAKLEAVIYAAEEPVTLAQLAALFAADALEWKAQQAAASAAQAPEPVGAEPLPLISEGFAFLEVGHAPAVYAPLELVVSHRERAPEPRLDSITETAAEPSREAGPDTSSDPIASIEENHCDSQSEERPDPVNGTGFSPYINPAESTRASAPEGSFSENSPDSPPLSAAGRQPGAEPSPKVQPDAESEARRQARLRDREVRTILRQLLDELIADFANDNRGIEIREIAGGYRMATKPECHDAVRLFVKSLKPPLKLSLPALETLAVVAYKQPVTAPEVGEIRGVDSAGVLGSLLGRKLIATAGRKQVIGRPILYKTTKEFLLRFGLKDLAELPSMEEFEKMAAIELDERGSESDGEAAEPAALEPDEDFDASNQEELESQESSGDSSGSSPSPLATETAAMADRLGILPGSPAALVESTPAETAPAEPHPIEQAETEIPPHGD
jgi:segregation and condensation protein B